MAYEMVMPYHLHMPSYFLETFTEYPYKTALACDKPEIFYVYNGNHLSVEKEYEESMTDSAMNVSW